jgi:hypothetical protein
LKEIITEQLFIISILRDYLQSPFYLLSALKNKSKKLDTPFYFVFIFYHYRDNYLFYFYISEQTKYNKTKGKEILT